MRELPLCGALHKIAMPISALDAVAKHEPRFGLLARRLADGTWALADIEVVLSAALRAGGSTASARDVIGYEGLTRAADVAFEALISAFDGPEDAEGKKLDGSKTETDEETSASTSASISEPVIPSA